MKRAQPLRLRPSVYCRFSNELTFDHHQAARTAVLDAVKLLRRSVVVEIEPSLFRIAVIRPNRLMAILEVHSH
jgi:hypothetical protein